MNVLLAENSLKRLIKCKITQKIVSSEFIIYKKLINVYFLLLLVSVRVIFLLFFFFFGEKCTEPI